MLALFGLGDDNITGPRELLKQHRRSDFLRNCILAITPIVFIAFGGASAHQFADVLAAPVAAFRKDAFQSTMILGFLGYLLYLAHYYRALLAYSRVGLEVSPEIVNQGGTVRLEVDLPGDAERTKHQLEAFVCQRRVYRSLHRGPFIQSGLFTPNHLFERTRSLDDVSVRDGTLTVEFELPDRANPSSFGPRPVTGFAAAERWDVGLRVQAPTYPSYCKYRPFVVRESKLQAAT